MERVTRVAPPPSGGKQHKGLKADHGGGGEGVGGGEFRLPVGIREPIKPIAEGRRIASEDAGGRGESFRETGVYHKTSVFFITFVALERLRESQGLSGSGKSLTIFLRIGVGSTKVWP